MSREEIEKKLDDLGRRRKRLTAAQQSLSDDTAQAVRLAADAGLPIAEIARRTGLSRQGVYDVLGR